MNYTFQAISPLKTFDKTSFTPVKIDNSLLENKYSQVNIHNSNGGKEEIKNTEMQQEK
jgi:hypothetical protein